MELTVYACKGGFYVAKLTDANHSERRLRSTCLRHGISYKANMKFYSLNHIRDLFAPLAPTRVWLRPECDPHNSLATEAFCRTKQLNWYSHARSA